MKICVFGAGAVGSYLAARLINAGAASVSVVARGEHLQAVRAGGILMNAPDASFRVHPDAATDRPSDLPPQDLVFVTLKATQLSTAAADIASLLDIDGRAVFVGNGVPWWWKLGAQGGAHLPLLDPRGDLVRVLGARTIGCVAYSMNNVVAPGEIRHGGNNRWILGGPDGRLDAILTDAVGLLNEAGLGAECTTDLRQEVWIKLLKNVPLNPICALTRLATDELASRPSLLALAQSLADEVVLLARVMGWDVSSHARAAVEAVSPRGASQLAKVKGARPSMLQDVLAGRPMEVAAILGQLASFAAEYEVEMPTLQAVLALLEGLDASLGMRGRRT